MCRIWRKSDAGLWGETARKVSNDAKWQLAKMAIFHKEMQNTQICNNVDNYLILVIKKHAPNRC